MDGYVCSDTDTSASYSRGPEKNSHRPFPPLSLLEVVTHQDWDTNTLNLQSEATTAAGREERCVACLPTPI